MSRDLLDDWQQSGSIHLWRYLDNLKNYPGWHLAADIAGHASMIDLLGRFASKAIDPPRSRTIRIMPPTHALLAVPNDPRSRIVIPDRLRIASSPESGEWTVTEQASALVITMGKQRFICLTDWLGDLDLAFDTSFGDPPRLFHWGINGRSEM